MSEYVNKYNLPSF